MKIFIKILITLFICSIIVFLETNVHVNVNNNSSYYIKYKSINDTSMIYFKTTNFKDDAYIKTTINSIESNFRFKSISYSTKSSFKKYNYVNYDGVILTIVYDGWLSIIENHIEYNNKTYKRFN